MRLYVDRAGRIATESDFGHTFMFSNSGNIRKLDGVSYFYIGDFDNPSSKEARQAARRKARELEASTKPRLGDIDIPEGMCRVRAHLRQRPGTGRRERGYKSIFLDGPKEVILERILLGCGTGRVIVYTPPKKKHRENARVVSVKAAESS
jgi:hypothetical protein